MRLLIEVAHWRLVVDLSPQCVDEDEVEFDVEAEGPPSRLDAHLGFGFTPDPVFPEFDWEEDEDVDTDTASGRDGASDPLP